MKTNEIFGVYVCILEWDSITETSKFRNISV